MQTEILKYFGAFAIGSMLLAGAQAQTNQDLDKTSEHQHLHSDAHNHSDTSSKAIYKGHFKDSQIEDRTLSDWQGDWQSVYPYLTEGILDPVMAHKAEHGSKTAAEYRAYYEIGYRTDVDRITIKGGDVTFYSEAGPVQGHYGDDGYEILTYKAGNRGVRYIFKKTGGDEKAPRFIQFSDHRVAPAQADHYHLYWGDDRAALLKEVTNWPTYYPSSLSGDQIVGEMLAH
jgi:zinc transport system substrate-binding protein